MSEKPLHVRVAEALGCSALQRLDTGVRGGEWTCDCDLGGRLHFTSPDDCRIPRYDTDWSATGPLIEQYGISVFPQDDEWHALTDPKGARWMAHGQAPLLAVCHVLLALHAAGKLPDGRQG